MDKRIVCIVIVAVVALVGILLYSTLEIYSEKTSFLPSREALANNYLALEKWLNETGHRVRVTGQSDPVIISAASERVVIVQASACTWDDAGEYIKPWIEQGGCLTVSLDYEDTIDEKLSLFLLDFGISAVLTPAQKFPSGENFPDFVYDIHFLVDNDVKSLTINDDYGYARLAEIYAGKGTLTVTGRPMFMYNYYLSREVNARLAWELTGARATGENSGVLFIREMKTVKSLFGKIMDRGNIFPLIFSALLLLILGFWMISPVFGLELDEKQKNSKPIRDRFLAEVRFLKKYDALDYYITVYERELKAETSNEKSNLSYGEIVKRLRKLESTMERF